MNEWTNESERNEQTKRKAMLHPHKTREMLSASYIWWEMLEKFYNNTKDKYFLNLNEW